MSKTMSLCFAALIVVGYVFIGVDIEYVMNQQIARGFISDSAVFFDVDNPSYEEAFFVTSEMIESEQAINQDGVVNVDQFEPEEAVNPEFVLVNNIQENGLTAVEEMLSSYDGENFIALHSGDMRAVYYSGDVDLPPISEGRFLSPDECLSDSGVAVVGRNLQDEIYEENGMKFIDYLGNKYDVIGITGVASSSALDNMIFVNLGSLSAPDQLNGIYYVDSSKNNEHIFDELNMKSCELLGCNLKVRETPKAFYDIVSGGMYLQVYLKIALTCLLVVLFSNAMYQYLRERKRRIAIMRLVGISSYKTILHAIQGYLSGSIVGIVVGIGVVLLLVLMKVFVLPVVTIMRIVLLLVLVSLVLVILGVVGTILYSSILKLGTVVNRE